MGIIFYAGIISESENGDSELATKGINLVVCKHAYQNHWINVEVIWAGKHIMVVNEQDMIEWIDSYNDYRTAFTLYHETKARESFSFGGDDAKEKELQAHQERMTFLLDQMSTLQIKGQSSV